VAEDDVARSRGRRRVATSLTLRVSISAGRPDRSAHIQRCRCRAAAAQSSACRSAGSNRRADPGFGLDRHGFGRPHRDRTRETAPSARRESSPRKRYMHWRSSPIHRPAPARSLPHGRHKQSTAIARARNRPVAIGIPDFAGHLVAAFPAPAVGTRPQTPTMTPHCRSADKPCGGALAELA